MVTPEADVAPCVASDVIDRVPTLGARAAYVRQDLRDTLLEHRQYIETHGEDPPEIRNWKWSMSGAPT